MYTHATLPQINVRSVVWRRSWAQSPLHDWTSRGRLHSAGEARDSRRAGEGRGWSVDRGSNDGLGRHRGVATARCNHAGRSPAPAAEAALVDHWYCRHRRYCCWRWLGVCWPRSRQLCPQRHDARQFERGFHPTQRIQSTQRTQEWWWWWWTNLLQGGRSQKNTGTRNNNGKVT